MKLPPELEAKILAMPGTVIHGTAPLPTNAPTEAPKRSKHRNTKTEIDGRTFDSKKEARRYLDLRAEQQDQRISELRCQVPIPLVVNGQLVCTYVADFSYIRDAVMVLEDVKSAHTRKLPEYRLKKKLLDALGIDVKEIL